MSDSNRESGSANVIPSRRISTVWIVPLVALCLGLWILVYQVGNRGPQIEIALETAEGLEKGKTKIKFRNVVVGSVEDIELNSESDGVLVRARIERHAEHLIRTNTQFWVVSPRVTVSGVSGLQTLLSGPYINLAPGDGDEDAREFVGLEAPPVTPVGTPGLRLTLLSEKAFTFKAGDQLIYQGMPVGRIETVEFDLERREAMYGAFVEAPFHSLITRNTRFWNANGIDLHLGADGIDVKTGSLTSLITGGISFDVPPGKANGKPVSENARFEIFASYEDAVAQRYREELQYLILIENSIRGLNVGAPVEYRGVRIGRVEKINVPLTPGNFQISTESFKIPVLISIQPGRANISDDEQGRELFREQLELWMAGGLRASLQVGNLLTGAVYVDLQHYDNVEPYTPGEQAGYAVIPTVPDRIGQLADQVNLILEKVNSLPFEAISTDVQGLLQELTSAVATLNGAGDTLSKRIDEFDLSSLNRSIDSLSRILNDFAQNTNGVGELGETMESIQSTMSELTQLLQKLNASPNSLIFKRRGAPDLQPRGIER